jgi:ABC-type branched-subunit amino acid transport system ATPase component
LLLDEPAAGMNPQETESLKHLVLKIRDEMDMAVLLIEHDMNMVMSLSDASTSWNTVSHRQRNACPDQQRSSGHQSLSWGGSPCLSSRNVSTFYGNIQALHGISLTHPRARS